MLFLEGLFSLPREAWLSLLALHAEGCSEG